MFLFFRIPMYTHINVHICLCVCMCVRGEGGGCDPLSLCRHPEKHSGLQRGSTHGTNSAHSVSCPASPRRPATGASRCAGSLPLPRASRGNRKTDVGGPAAVDGSAATLKRRAPDPRLWMRHSAPGTGHGATGEERGGAGTGRFAHCSFPPSLPRCHTL